MNPGMLKKFQKMQKELMAAQKELEASIFQGKAGGIVEVEIKGSKEVLNVKINPDSIEGKDDIEMLQDTIVAAINDAMKKIETETQELLNQYTGGMGGNIPGLF